MKGKPLDDGCFKDNILAKKYAKLMIIALILLQAIMQNRESIQEPASRIDQLSHNELTEHHFMKVFGCNMKSFTRKSINNIVGLNLPIVKLKQPNCEKLHHLKTGFKYIGRTCCLTSLLHQDETKINDSSLGDHCFIFRENYCEDCDRASFRQKSNYFGDRFFIDKNFKNSQTYYDEVISALSSFLNHSKLFLVCICVSLAHAYACAKLTRMHTKNTTPNRQPNINPLPASITEHKQYKRNWHFVFDFRSTFPTNLVTLPFSINNYAEDIVKRDISGEPLMKYEWSRYLSFEKFPFSSNMRPMRLAQAGFFYTGQGQEVKCFCCGLTNNDWSTGETPIELHRRKSPHCKFICRENSNNVSIHVPEYYNDVFQTTHTDADPSPSGANGGPLDLSQRFQNNTTTTQNNSKQNSNISHNSELNSHINTVVETQRNLNRGHGLGDQSGRSNPRDTMSPKAMKHPDYAERSARLATFQNWPYTDIQDPAELADAGLFYAGVNDCVRCYYCGLGLKNWEREDNPWSEHERWSNSCGHLLQHSCNGDLQGSGPSGSQSHITETERPITSPTISPPSSNNRASQPACENTEGNSLPSVNQSGSSSSGVNLNSVAARSVLEMGYDKKTVTTAIHKYQETHNKHPNNSSDIMEILLESEEDVERPSKTAPSKEPSDMTKVSTVEVKTQNSESKKPTQNTKGKGKKTGKKTQVNGEARSLIAQNKALKEQRLCKICMDNDANVVFLPCGHMVSCQKCSVSLRKCAVCRDLIRGCVRVYQS